jgi:hypothetical protein
LFQRVSIKFLAYPTASSLWGESERGRHRASGSPPFGKGTGLPAARYRSNAVHFRIARVRRSRGTIQSLGDFPDMIQKKGEMPC